MPDSGTTPSSSAPAVHRPCRPWTSPHSSSLPSSNVRRSLAEPNRIVGELIQPGGGAPCSVLALALTVSMLSPYTATQPSNPGGTVPIPCPYYGAQVSHSTMAASCRTSTQTPVLVAPPGVDLLEVTVTKHNRMPARHMLGVSARREDGAEAAEMSSSPMDASPTFAAWSWQVCPP